MQIRAGSIEEIIDVDKRIKEFDRGHLRSSLIKLEQESAILLVAVENDEIIGYSASYDEFHDGSLYACFGGVLPEFRRKGVYSRLAAKREEIAKEKGYTSIKLYTRNKRREILSFLISRGWNIIGFINKSKVAENRILFEKVVT